MRLRGLEQEEAARVLYCLSPSGTGPVSKDDPANTWRPSASVTVLAFAPWEESFERKPATVTTWPGFSEFLVQPRLINPLGGPSSQSQLTIFPLSSFTSM